MKGIVEKKPQISTVLFFRGIEFYYTDKKWHFETKNLFMKCLGIKTADKFHTNLP